MPREAVLYFATDCCAKLATLGVGHSFGDTVLALIDDSGFF